MGVDREMLFDCCKFMIRRGCTVRVKDYKQRPVSRQPLFRWVEEELRQYHAFILALFGMRALGVKMRMAVAEFVGIATWHEMHNLRIAATSFQDIAWDEVDA